jgi:hypothetical protein
MKQAHEMAGSTHAVVRCKSNQIPHPQLLTGLPGLKRLKWTRGPNTCRCCCEYNLQPKHLAQLAAGKWMKAGEFSDL